jgi:hypothetical protein
MADLVDVENELVTFVAAALYPSGATPGQPSVAGPVCKVYRGWPIPASLDADLTAGIVNVTVFAEGGGGANTTRCQTDWQQSVAATPQVVLSVSSNVVTVSGAIQAGDVALIKVGFRNAYATPITSGSTLASIASALAALVAVNYPGTVAVGTAITVATSSAVFVATGGAGTAWKELERQTQIYRITVWCPTPTARDLVGPVLKLAFSQINRLPLADNSYASVKYQRSIVTDKNQNEQSYRRDFFYTVEFPTSITASFPTIGAFVANTTGGVSPPDATAVPSVV